VAVKIVKYKSLKIDFASADNIYESLDSQWDECICKKARSCEKLLWQKSAHVSEEPIVSIFRLFIFCFENRDSRFLRNVGTHLSNYIAPQS
jgi:hypothetical protein